MEEAVAAAAACLVEGGVEIGTPAAKARAEGRGRQQRRRAAVVVVATGL